ncbi:hypothetical protein [Bosea vaviloviae]|nr:hypothetical protein [Bosea vaviloviae]
MLTERISQRFVDPVSWMTGEALEGEKSAVAALRARQAMASNL